jgi:hypothetical protein
VLRSVEGAHSSNCRSASAVAKCARRNASHLVVVSREDDQKIGRTVRRPSRLNNLV